MNQIRNFFLRETTCGFSINRRESSLESFHDKTQPDARVYIINSVSRLVPATVTLNLGLFDDNGDKNNLNYTCRRPGTCLQIFLKHILKALKLDKGSSSQ